MFNSEDEGFGIERDILDDAADEFEAWCSTASRNEVPNAQRKNERKEKLRL